VTEVTARKRAEVALRESEAYWRGLFEQMAEGFILGSVVRDKNGVVVDWRYKEVNRARGELVGIPADQAVGQTIRDLFPGIEEEWISQIADVVQGGNPEYSCGRSVRSADGTRVMSSHSAATTSS